MMAIVQEMALEMPEEPLGFSMISATGFKWTASKNQLLAPCMWVASRNAAVPKLIPALQKP